MFNKKLKDIQNLYDNRGIHIQKVGVKGVETPLTIQRKNNSDQIVFAKVNMAVNLPENYKGTHMSRFLEVLNEWKENNNLCNDIRGFLVDLQNKLESKTAHVNFAFKYFIEKEAPVSKSKSSMSYDCYFEGFLNEDKFKFFLGVKVPVTTLCPCSKEISDNGAHNQRAVIKVKVSYDEKENLWLEDLIKSIEECGSAQLYPILKREDEKFVTEQAYNNPKFVEDVLRDVVLKLRNNKIINYHEVEIIAYESIHNHCAWAYQEEKEEEKDETFI